MQFSGSLPLHCMVYWLHVTCKRFVRPHSKHIVHVCEHAKSSSTMKSSHAPFTMADYLNDFDYLAFWVEFRPQLCLLQLPCQGLNWLPLWLVTVWFCNRHGWGLCGKRLWEMHIVVMTMVWQLTAAKECMDGILLLIKGISPPISWYFTDSLLLLSSLCDLSAETWLSTPELGCCESTLNNT